MVFLPATYTYLSKLKSGVIFAKLSQPGTLLCIFLIEARKIWDQQNIHKNTNLEPRNTYKKTFWTHEVPRRKNLGPKKYPRRYDGTIPIVDPLDPRDF